MFDDSPFPLGSMLGPKELEDAVVEQDASFH